MYPGIKLPRVQGKEYEEFIEEFMQAVTHKWGKQVLIQFEDFGNHNAFKVLDTILRFFFYICSYQGRGANDYMRTF